MESIKSQEILKLSGVSLTDENGFETILDNISFNLNQGDRVGIMGFREQEKPLYCDCSIV